MFVIGRSLYDHPVHQIVFSLRDYIEMHGQQNIKFE